MPKELKVFGFNMDGRHRGIVAATSKAAAIKAFGVSKPSASMGGQTSNPLEVETAMAEPGVIFVSKISGQRKYSRVEPGAHYMSVFK